MFWFVLACRLVIYRQRIVVMRVLVVEDDQKIASFVTAGLKQAGFAVDHSADGEEGLHLAVTESYDVAVMDIMLPKRDGLSLITELLQI